MCAWFVQHGLSDGFTVNNFFFFFFSFLHFSALHFCRLPFTANKTHTWTNNNSQFSWALHSLLLVLPVADVAAVAHSTHSLVQTIRIISVWILFIFFAHTFSQQQCTITLFIHTHAHIHTRTRSCRCVFRYVMLCVLACSRVCAFDFFFLFLLSSFTSLIHSLFLSVRACVCFCE